MLSLLLYEIQLRQLTVSVVERRTSTSIRLTKCQTLIQPPLMANTSRRSLFVFESNRPKTGNSCSAVGSIYKRKRNSERQGYEIDVSENILDPVTPINFRTLQSTDRLFVGICHTAVPPSPLVRSMLPNALSQRYGRMSTASRQ